MVSRFSLFFFLILCGLLAIYAFLSRPPVCVDPTGCIWIGPNEPIELGVSVFTAGTERPLSLEIQQSMELFSKDQSASSPDHPLRIRTYYSSCLPNAPVQSTVDLSADSHVLAVIGPICKEDAVDFSQRMVSANKIAISPVPYRGNLSEIGFSFSPDINQLASQTAVWIQSMGYSRIIVTHDIDEQSSSFSTKMCEFFRSNGACLDNTPGSTELPPEPYDASVDVFLDESNPPTLDFLNSSSTLPTILVSFSRPAVNLEQSTTLFWIGPRFWNENKDYSAAYFAKFNSYPLSFASWVVYDRLPMIYDTIRAAAVKVWDGSLIIPMDKLKQLLGSNFAKDDIFCPAASSDCPKFPFAVYQVSGNDYTLIKP